MFSNKQKSTFEDLDLFIVERDKEEINHKIHTKLIEESTSSPAISENVFFVDIEEKIKELQVVSFAQEKLDSIMAKYNKEFEDEITLEVLDEIIKEEVLDLKDLSKFDKNLLSQYVKEQAKIKSKAAYSFAKEKSKSIISFFNQKRLEATQSLSEFVLSEDNDVNEEILDLFTKKIKFLSEKKEFSLEQFVNGCLTFMDKKNKIFINPSSSSIYISWSLPEATIFDIDIKKENNFHKFSELKKEIEKLFNNYFEFYFQEKFGNIDVSEVQLENPFKPNKLSFYISKGKPTLWKKEADLHVSLNKTSNTICFKTEKQELCFTPSTDSYIVKIFKQLERRYIEERIASLVEEE